jgi:ABC-2 type transport system ATP-binding protein
VTAVLRAAGLTKTFGPVRALDGLDVDVPAGRIGFVGANGAGKTTFFRLVLGLIHPTSGSVEVLGRAVASDPVGVRTRIGYMPEHDCLPGDQTAADVVATLGELSGLPARAARQRASDVLNLVGLDEERFRPIATFSTGMKQRAKLAQALVADPKLVLLDEPTAGLDPSGRDGMLDLVHRLGDFGISVVMATHILEDVQRVCDYVVMLDGGRLVAAGPTADLTADTAAVIVEVAAPARPLALALEDAGLSCALVDGHVEVMTEGPDDLDVIRDTVAELGLPLLRLATRGHSLDEVFRERAT